MTNMDTNTDSLSSRFHRTFSFRKIDKGFVKNGRKMVKKQNHLLKKSASTSQVGRLADKTNINSLDKKMSNQPLSVGNLKKNLSFRKSFSTRLKSLPSFRSKAELSVGKQRKKEDEAMTLFVDKIRLHSLNSKDFRKRIIRRFRSHSHMNEKEDLVFRKQITCSNISAEGMKSGTQGLQKCVSANLTMKLKSRITAASEEVDFTDLIKPVTLNKKRMQKMPKLPIDSQTRLLKEIPTPSIGDYTNSSENMKPDINHHTYSGENRTPDFDGSEKVAEFVNKNSIVSKTDKDDVITNDNVNSAKPEMSDSSDNTADTRNTKGMLYRDNGLVAIVECSPSSSTSAVSPTCADIYGQDEGVDMTFTSSNDHSLSSISYDPLLKDETNDQGLMQEQNVSVTDVLEVSENDFSLVINNEKEKAISDKGYNDQGDKMPSVKQNYNSVKDDLSNILQQDRHLQLKEVMTDNCEHTLGYDEVDNPWVLRTDLSELSEGRQGNTLKSMNFISEYSVDDSIGFNVNRWNDYELKGNIETRDNKESSEMARLTRNDSVESIDSFSSSIHSVHSEDLFFSASEPEMEPDQLSLSSGESGPNTPLDKPKGLLKIEEADEQISPGLLQKKEKCKCKTIKPSNKNAGTESHVKSLNDLNKSDTNISSTPRRISSYLSGLKPFYFDLNEKTKASRHEKLSQRRSLDSNIKIQQMTLDLNMNESPALKNKSTSSSDSGLNNALLPGTAKGSKSSKKARRRTVDVTADNDNVRFFTLPARRKTKSDILESPRRKVTRISSISKMFSDKAHSLSSMKLGSSFKLRNTDYDGDKSKLPSFLKTSSLTNLMAKKGAEMASSISTLIRGRSNSNTVVNSPFKQSEKPRQTDKADKREFQYERVWVPCARKRPATTEEILAWKKRLTLNVELANSLSAEESIRLRADSFVRRSHWSGSRLVRSPTLLDEIMKSVDNTRFRSLGSAGEFDLDDSDDGDSSNEGTGYNLFTKQVSVCSGGLSNYKLKNEVPLSLCHKCGNVLSGTTDTNMTKQIEDLLNSKHSHSLCDLRKTCKCIESQFRSSKGHRHRYNSHRKSLQNRSGSATTSPQSSVVSDENSNIGSPNSSQNSENGYSFKFASMFELRDLTNHGPDICTTDFDKECLELVGTGSGSLLRHKPMLDLSADNLLDVTDETDSGVVMYDMDRRSRERRSQSCDDVTTCDKITPDGDSFYSCTDMMTDNDVQTPNTKPYLLPTTKSLSCDDILNETENILIDSALKHEEKTQHKKEIRKAKVKSLSSSHDALSMFFHAESLDLDIDDIIKSPGEETEEIKKLSNYISESFVSNTEHIKAENHDQVSEMCDESLNICDKKENQKESENDKNKNPSIIYNGLKQEVGKNITHEKDIQNSDRHRTLSERMDRGVTLLTKPPLPRKTHRKVLSVNDIKLQCDTNVPTFLKRNKRYSMIEMSGKQSAEHLSEFKTKSKQSDDNIVQKCRVKSQSCDYINSAHHLGTPKFTDSRSIDASKFLFSEEHIQSYTLKNPKLQDKHTSIQKSVSSGNVPKDSFSSKLSSNSSYSMVSLNRLSNQSYSDDVFQRLSSISPPQVVLSPPEKLLSLDGFIEFSGTNNTFSRLSELPTPEVMPDFSSIPDMDTVLKYDINLGFLLHSIQCDNRIVCFYSFQRNKQLMESVITPLAVPPDVQHKRSNESNHLNTPKLPNKSKSDDLPNPAAPITSVPSERLLHAGQVLRTVLLARAPHMIRDRKFHLRTYRRCMVGTEMVDWLMQQCSLVHSRNQAVGMWQALVEEGVVVHVCHEHQFKDKYLFYRFHEDDEGVSTVPSNSSKRECEDELQEMFLMLAQIGPDAMMRMILRKLPHERTMEDLEIIYEELLHIKALSHLSTMVKRELASVLVFESHAKSGTVLFNQGDEGKSWYIILKGSVNVVIYGKGVVCTLHEGDDFGKLALVNDAPRAATIVLRDDNCHFLRVDKDDFNRILRDVEANTVRLKEHGQDVLVLEKIPSNTQTSDGTVHAHYKYSVMAGTPEKMLEHLLETRLDNKKEDEIDGFLEDFILTHVIFMPCNHLCPVLLSHYHSSATETTEQEAFEFMFNHKKCVLHFVQEWGNIIGPAFKEDHTINAFLEELHSCVLDDLVSYPSLRDDLETLDMVLSAQTQTQEGKSKKRASGNFALSRKPSSKEAPRESHRQKISIRHTDENIFKVYCADHTYSTLKLSMDTTVENLLLNIKEKLDLGDELILCEVKSSGERIILKENDLSVTSGLSINGRLFVTPREHLDALTPLPEQEGPSEGTFTTIELFSSREMAYYMTLYDWELFTSVQEYELIYQVFGRYKFQKITANLDLFLRRFNEIQFWIVTEMVLTTTLSKRVALLRKFIKLAAHCKEYQNLNSFFAVVMGLSNIAVSRLSQTWEKLPSKFKKMFVEFETLMDPSRNHRVYRLTVAKMAPPILPFMPLLMKDMTFTHEGNKTYFDGLVNFEKMRMISQTLKTVRFCRSSNIDLEMPGSNKSADAMSYIRNLHVIDNQRLLTQLSHKLEPRKT